MTSIYGIVLTASIGALGLFAGSWIHSALRTRPGFHRSIFILQCILVWLVLALAANMGIALLISLFVGIVGVLLCPARPLWSVPGLSRLIAVGSVISTLLLAAELLAIASMILFPEQ